LEDSTKQCVKVLEGHKKAVREIAYAASQKILISCGFDFEVFVWNPYLKENIMSLKGHEQPLVGVNVLPGMNCFITADAKGTVNVWSILDYSKQQSFTVPGINTLTCIRAVPKHRRLICGSRKFIVFQYDKPFLPEFSDDNPISAAIFSSLRFELYVAGDRSIKIWNAKTGTAISTLKDCMKSEITRMTLDDEHRKLIVGSDSGELKVFDIHSGINTHNLHSHDPQEGEICYIGYGGADHTIISIGWDQVI
jgi:WD40 repeat protein